MRVISAYTKKLIAADKRRAQIKAMAKTVSVREIAWRLGISRTRVYQIIAK